ncbi:MAG: hypothetical protein DCC52_14760 [Chloroflexi bacterium]|nr:MAG: hypothetical protein DCC52_14760 [Chloroflexota bacterium]
MCPIIKISYYRLATIHNLQFMLTFMREVCAAIRENRRNEFRAEG